MGKEKILLSEKELRRVEVIERLIIGEITNSQAARLLNLSVRQIKRIKKGVKEDGLSSLAHKIEERNLSMLYPMKLKRRLYLYTSLSIQVLTILIPQNF